MPVSSKSISAEATFTCSTQDREMHVNAETVLFFCKPKGILTVGRQCVVLVSQAGPDEVHVYAKFWDYIVSNKVSISIFRGISPDSLIPIHKGHFPPDQAAAIDARRREPAESLHNALKNELR